MIGVSWTIGHQLLSHHLRASHLRFELSEPLAKLCLNGGLRKYRQAIGPSLWWCAQKGRLQPLAQDLIEKEHGVQVPISLPHHVSSHLTQYFGLWRGKNKALTQFSTLIRSCLLNSLYRYSTSSIYCTNSSSSFLDMLACDKTTSLIADSGWRLPTEDPALEEGSHL
jgi:hypothetical protein